MAETAIGEGPYGFSFAFNFAASSRGCVGAYGKYSLKNGVYGMFPFASKAIGCEGKAP